MRSSSAMTAAVSWGSMFSWRTFQVMARYMAPELTMTRPRRLASRRASVLLPEAAGPSMAMAKWGVVDGWMFTRGKRLAG